MTFTRIGDEFPHMARHLSDGAFRTHVEALIWSVSRELDLCIPKDDVRRFAETTIDIPDVVAELLDKEWWIDAGEHYDVGAFQEGRTRAWQYTREQRAAKRRKDAEAQAKYRAKRVGNSTSISAPTQPNPTPDKAHDSVDESSHDSVDYGEVDPWRATA